MSLPAPGGREHVVAVVWLRAKRTRPSSPMKERARARLLLLAAPTSYRVNAYRAAAESIGVELLIGSEGEFSLISQSSDGLRLSLQDVDATIDCVLEESNRRPISGVVAADDSTVELTSHVAQALGLPHNPLSAAKVSRRKDLGRQALLAAGLPVPHFSRIDLSRDLSCQLHADTFPCVVKPLSLSGSRGVIRANNLVQLRQAVTRIQEILSTAGGEGESGLLLVEDYIPGKEVAVEGLLRGGDLEVLAIFDKPDLLEGPFFEETYYITPSRHSPGVQDQIKRMIARACRAYGLREGPIHAEARLFEDHVWVLEIAARTIGGDCARLLRFGTGHTLEAMVLAHAAAIPLQVKPQTEAAGVMMLPIVQSGCLRRVEGILEARRVPGIEDVVIAVREGYELISLPEGSSYLGFLFARGSDPAAAESALREAYSKLNVVVSPVWRVQTSVTSSLPAHGIPQEDPRIPPLRKRNLACVSR